MVLNSKKIALLFSAGEQEMNMNAYEEYKTITFTFSRRFYPKRLTRYTHFTLMAHGTSGAIRGSVSCSRTLRQGIELATFCLLNDFFTSCTTVTLTRITSLFLVSVWTSD